MKTCKAKSHNAATGVQSCFLEVMFARHATSSSRDRASERQKLDFSLTKPFLSNCKTTRKRCDLPFLQVIYVSRCLVDPAELPHELERLLATSRAKNRENAITGCLACEQGLFIQVIEGEAMIVDRLFARIQTDRRHTDVTVRLRREVRARSFPDWAVAHVHPGSPVSDKTAGTPWGDPLAMPPVVLLSHLMALADASRR